MHYNIQSYDMAYPCCQSYTDIRFCSSTYTAPHRTATGLWMPGPAHETKGTAQVSSKFPAGFGPASVMDFGLN